MKSHIQTLLFCSLLLILGSCQKNQTASNKAVNYEFIEEDYSADWAQVNELERKGLGKSVVQKVDEILLKAKEAGNYHQIFKALAHRSKYISAIEEESSFKILSTYEAEIEQAEFPLKNLLHSAIGELYVQYLNQNQWRFQGRTKTELFNPQDLRTWSLERIHEQAVFHFKASLNQKNDLSQFPTSHLNSILNPVDTNNKQSYSGFHLHDNLFDFLGHRALNYFKNPSGFINKPTNEFDIDEYDLFGSYEEFIAIKANHPDTNSSELLSLHLYQDLMKSNANQHIEKRTYLDLTRLRHYYQVSKKENKDSLYEAALTKKRSNLPENLAIRYDLAKLYSQWGNQYEYPDTNKRWYLKKAHHLLNGIPDENSYDTKRCLALKAQIEQKSISFKVEQYNLPNTPILFFLSYKNVDKLYLRIVNADGLDIESPTKHFSNEEEAKELTKAKPIFSKELNINNPEDFQNHNSEQYIKGLSIGAYYLLISTDPEFNSSKSDLCYEKFYTSELTYISRKNSNKGGTELFVLNRNTGEAVSKASIETYSYEYNYDERKNQRVNGPKYTSNQDGFAFIPVQEKRNNFYFIIKKDQDQISSGRHYNYYRNGQNERIIKQTKLFTDRAIYRPGQTVYFKGIVYETKGNQHTTKSQEKIEVKLLDVNHQEVSKNSFTSNDYGSFEGNFILPNSGLTGAYQIRTKSGSISIQVEEYKRPTFRIEIDSLDGELELNQNVQVKGKVKAFAGNAISDAQVNYRVVRNTEFPYWYYYRGFYPSSPEKEIAKGKLQSDGQGNFQFEFLAQADKSVSSQFSPIYSYEIMIDAISPNGETQSESQRVRISRSPFIISTNLSRSVELSALQKLVISCKNLSGKKIDKKGEVKLIKLKHPKHYLKPKYWEEEIDINVIDKAKYNELFPEYNNSGNNELENLEIDFEINSSAFDANTVLDLYDNIKPGAYELQILIPNANGETTVQNSRFTLYNPTSRQLAIPVFDSYKAIKSSGEPGEKAQFLIGTSLSNLRLLYEIEHEGKIVSKKWIILNNEQRLIEIPIEEKHRGGFSVHFIGVHSNRIIRYDSKVSVPFTNKKLNLKLTSFRDKIKPGSKEMWSIQVTGIDNTKVQSELLLSMYDKSLDQFRKEDWELNPYRGTNYQLYWDYNHQFNSVYSNFYGPNFNKSLPQPNRFFPSLNWFGLRLGYGYSAYADARHVELLGGVMEFDKPAMAKNNPRSYSMDSAPAEIKSSAVDDSDMNYSMDLDELIEMQNELQEKKNASRTAAPIRTNFNETAFFYPQTKTNKNGEASFQFTMPDALTEWKFRAFAHSKSLAIGNMTQSIKTQKELMVFPNAPRFFREGDLVEFSSLISNLSENTIEGSVKIRFYDAFTNQPIQIIKSSSTDQTFNILKGENTQVTWSIQIPEGLKAISYRIQAETDDFSDGEEKAIPVLLNRMLVTESLPLAMRANQEKTFTFEKLKNSGSAKNLSHHLLSLEFTPNPVWYAIQALPYISEQSNECSEQVFTRLYANSIAEHIAKSQPRIQQIFDLWRTSNSAELVSKLEQNQELKTALIEETPWLQEAQTETEQKKRIALLFDYNRMAMEKESASKKLSELQTPNGGWAWYKGMRDNRYITQYIVSGFGHLQQLGISDYPSIIEKAVQYLDKRIQEDYKRLIQNKADLTQAHIGYTQIQYLYARSFFKAIKLPQDQTAFNYYINQAEKYWLNQNNYMKGMIALALNRYKPDLTTPKLIITSLADHAILDDEMGMYWKDNTGGYYWHNAKIETQALLIEAFDEIGQDLKIVDELKLWLLKQKQTQSWSSSKATAEACYVLLMRGTNLLQSNSHVFIQLGNESIDSKLVAQEAGTGYFKKVWNTAQIKPEMGELIVQNKNQSTAWGAIYWQYYQNLNDISSATASGLKLSKTLFKSIVKEQGEVLVPISTEEVKLGDKIVMRLRLESDRDLEFVHLKDMRASGFEPIQVLSGYKYQDGIGYYQSTKDASSNFYMDYLNKGVYVFEYAVRATIAGEFANGISSIQCQYAPEFSSHSSGQLVKIVR